MTWGAIVVGALLGPFTNILQERKFKRVTEANGGILVPESRLEMACVAGVGASISLPPFLREKHNRHFASRPSLPNLPVLVRMDIVSIRTLARACRCACPVRSSFSFFLSPSFTSLTTFSRSIFRGGPSSPHSDGESDVHRRLRWCVFFSSSLPPHLSNHLQN